jgi:signal transduction histidine kinase/DNA-binding NarL/FixJ family response regulator
MHRLSGDSILVATYQGLFALHDGALKSLDPDIVSTGAGPLSVAVSNDGDRWMSIDRRLYRNGYLVLESRSPIMSIALDHEGSLWVAADGLHRLKPALFRTYGPADGAVANVYPIFEDSRGRIWLGSLSDGIVRFEEGEFRVVARGKGAPSLPQVIFEDRVGRIWVGRINYGACILDGAFCTSQVLSGHTVKAIYEDTGGSLWFGTDGGLYRDSLGTMRHFTTDDGLPHDFVRVIRETRDGSLWLGTNGGGVARYSRGRIESLTTENGLSSNLVRSIHEDEDGVIWIGTEDRGLNRVALTMDTAADSEHAALASAAQISVIRRQDGLYDDGIHSILPDGYGRFWMSSNRGIFWVLRSDLMDFLEGRVGGIHSVSYTERDGIENREGNGGVQSPAIVAGDGRLWFATQAGVSVVDPADTHPSEAPFPVYVERIRSAGDRSARHSIESDSVPVRLASNQRDFEVEYTALSFLAPENLRFQYRLVGFQEEWVEAGGRRTAFYTNVPPGTYEFEVRATRGDGVWYEPSAPRILVVQPQFFETLWFRLMIAGSILGLLFAAVRYRERKHLSREEELSDLVADRTAMIEAQAAKLREIDEAKSRFFANISHEFRTPLTLTIGPLEDILAGAHGPTSPQAEAQLQLSLRNSRRLLRLVNQLLDVARIESGQMKLLASRRDLVPFVEGICLAFVPLAERNSVAFNRQLPPEPVFAYFDPDLLEKVLINLLSNAFKFTQPRGAVRLSLASEPQSNNTDEGPGTAVIEVRDNGPGIASEHLPHLFERFYRIRGKGRRKGTGIGLSLARELAELHGGGIEVTSEKGFGSVFTLRLLLGRSHLQPEQVDDEPASYELSVTPSVDTYDSSLAMADSNGDRPDTVNAISRETPDELSVEDATTVLVIDDSADIRTYLRAHLEPRYRVLEAADGIEGLETVRERIPDLVISDLLMPGLNGIELCETMKADPELDFIPVLLLTANASLESRVEGLGTGADDYLTKPFSMPELTARVENLIESRRRLRQRLRVHTPLAVGPIEAQSSDEAFLEKLSRVIEERMDDPDFGVDELARSMSESRSNLYRRLGKLGVPSAAELIRSLRLQRAGQLLSARAGTVGEVAYGTGFRSVSHFSRCFKQEYGTSPSRYRDQQPAES